MCILILYGKYDIILYKKYTGPSFSVNYPIIHISKQKTNRIKLSDEMRNIKWLVI